MNINYSVNNKDWLTYNSIPVSGVPCSTNKFSSGRNICDYIVMHFTGGSTLASAHTTYQAPNTQVSWHLTIGPDGKIFQLILIMLK